MSIKWLVQDVLLRRPPHSLALCLMNTIRHLAIAILINGTLAVLMWMSYAWIKVGPFWSPDTPIVWVNGIVIVGLFILLVCWPTLNYSLKNKPLVNHILVSSILGLIFVLAFFAFRTRYPFNLENMLIRIWLYYLIFFVVGGLYGFMHYRHSKA